MCSKGNVLVSGVYMERKAIVRIEKLSQKGFGVAKIGARKVEIPGAIPGETVVVRLGRKKLGYIVKFIEKSSRRTVPVCPHTYRCGGCLWQDIKYDEQLRLKQSMLQQIYSCIEGSFEIRKMLPSPQIFGYRGKMEFVFAEGSSGLALGLREYGYFDRVVDIQACWLQPLEANKALLEFKTKLNILGYSPYNIYTHRGFLRYLVIRTSSYNEEVLVNIITTSQGGRDRPKLDFEFLLDETIASTVIWSVNDSLADVARGEIRQVYGRGYLIEESLGFKFKVCPFCFYQSNPNQAKILFRLAKELGGEGEVALDLYSGIGTIAIIVSENFEKVVGIEIEEHSIKVAKENAKMNDVHNVEFFVGKVEEELGKISESFSKVDTIFLDPPRSGIHKNVRKMLAKIKPERIVYISCNPRTQADDIDYLIHSGYRLVVVQPVDMLPHTPHIETVALLEKD